MGRRGPHPSPSSKRTADGRNTSRRLPPPEDVSAPAWLAGDALAFWQDHAPGVSAAGRLRQDQAETFAILCQIAIDCRELAAQVAAEGWVTATDKGQAASPVARLLRDSRRDFVALAREFGLTASSAARIPQEAEHEQEDPEAEILRAFTSGAG